MSAMQMSVVSAGRNGGVDLAFSIGTSMVVVNLTGIASMCLETMIKRGMELSDHVCEYLSFEGCAYETRVEGKTVYEEGTHPTVDGKLRP